MIIVLPFQGTWGAPTFENRFFGKTGILIKWPRKAPPGGAHFIKNIKRGIVNVSTCSVIKMGDQNVVLRTWRVWPKDRISQELNSWNHQHCSSAIVFDSVLTINRLVIAGHLYVAHHSPALDISGQHLPNAWMSNDRSPMSLHISNPCRNIFIHILYAMRKNDLVGNITSWSEGLHDETVQTPIPFVSVEINSLKIRGFVCPYLKKFTDLPWGEWVHDSNIKQTGW